MENIKEFKSNHKHPQENSRPCWGHWSDPPIKSNQGGSHSCFRLRWWTEWRTNRAEHESIPPFTTWKLPVKWGRGENKLIIFLLSVPLHGRNQSLVVLKQTWSFGITIMHHKSNILGAKYKHTHNSHCFFLFLSCSRSLNEMKKLHLLFQAYINNYSALLSQQKLNHRSTLRSSLCTLQNYAISFGTCFNIINYSDFM